MYLKWYPIEVFPWPHKLMGKLKNVVFVYMHKELKKQGFYYLKRKMPSTSWLEMLIIGQTPEHFQHCRTLTTDINSCTTAAQLSERHPTLAPRKAATTLSGCGKLALPLHVSFCCHTKCLAVEVQLYVCRQGCYRPAFSPRQQLPERLAAEELACSDASITILSDEQATSWQSQCSLCRDEVVSYQPRRTEFLARLLHRALEALEGSACTSCKPTVTQWQGSHWNSGKHHLGLEITCAESKWSTPLWVSPFSWVS